jgi:hypothetical protein
MAKKPVSRINKVEGEPPAPPRSARSYTSLLVIALAFVVAIGALAYKHVGRSEPDEQADAVNPPPLAPLPGPPVNARFGPHTQAVFPPLPFGGFPPPRPVDVVGAAYKFAAEHPEVLGYVPCYCGCERSGHRGNDDCFVSRRAANGDVIEWEPHGMT